MQYIAGYLLCIIGHEKADEHKIKEIVEASGATFEQEKLGELLKAMEGKDVWQVIEEGKKQMGSLAAAPAAAAPAAGAASSEEKKEEAAEEKKEEEEEEEEEDFGFDSLF